MGWNMSAVDAAEKDLQHSIDSDRATNNDELMFHVWPSWTSERHTLITATYTSILTVIHCQNADIHKSTFSAILYADSWQLVCLYYYCVILMFDVLYDMLVALVALCHL